MKIAGVVKCSLVDYPGKLAAVVFTQGCNLRCSYCHNRELIEYGAVCSTPQEEVLAWLKKRHGLLDAVVISGGEPTLQPGLAGFMAEVRSLGYPVKLDTNGTHPDVLAALIKEDVLDYVAMDIKAPPDKYDAICGVPIDHTTIDESIAQITNGHVDYEFRTTIVPQLTREDILAIGHRIRGANSYVLQCYRTLQPTEDAHNTRRAPAQYPPFWLNDVRLHLDHIAKSCSIRGFDLHAIPTTYH